MADTCGCRSHNGFLTVRGYAEHAQRELEKDALDAVALQRYLDIYGSVSANEIDLFWDDFLLEDQHRRFLHGS